MIDPRFRGAPSLCLATARPTAADLDPGAAHGHGGHRQRQDHRGKEPGLPAIDQAGRQAEQEGEDAGQAVEAQLDQKCGHEHAPAPLVRFRPPARPAARTSTIEVNKPTIIVTDSHPASDPGAERAALRSRRPPPSPNRSHSPAPSHGRGRNDAVRPGRKSAPPGRGGRRRHGPGIGCSRLRDDDDAFGEHRPAGQRPAGLKSCMVEVRRQPEEGHWTRLPVAAIPGPASDACRFAPQFVPPWRSSARDRARVARSAARGSRRKTISDQSPAAARRPRSRSR